MIIGQYIKAPDGRIVVVVRVFTSDRTTCLVRDVNGYEFQLPRAYVTERVQEKS